MRLLNGTLFVAVLCLGFVQTSQAEFPGVELLLTQGKLDQAEQVLDGFLSQGENDRARFQLGTVRFLQAVEGLTQAGVKYGAKTQLGGLPIIGVAGFAANQEDAEPIEYEDVRRMIEEFQQRIAKAEETLAPIKDEAIQWDLNFNDVAIDFDGDGQIAKSERLDVLFRGVMNRRQPNQRGKPLVVGLDAADAVWLQGYCHVLMGIADMMLAYDHKEAFEKTAHAYFANPQTDFARKREFPIIDRRPGGFAFEPLIDYVALIHLMDFKTREPGRLRDAQQHFLKMVELSRKNWELIQAEEDDHLEWIPNAKQTSVISSLRVGDQQIKAWHDFLEEAEDVLRGKKLVPFWRKGFEKDAKIRADDDPRTGINLARVFTDPRDFDLILWVQGTDALPYLERGDVSRQQTWAEFNRVFRGQFLGFALWVN